MPLLPNRGPPLAPTHAPIPMEELFALRNRLRDAAPDGKVTWAIVDAVAAERAAPRARVVAALAMDPNLVLQMDQPVLLAVCVGGCQAQGAVPILERLVTLRSERLAQGKPAFDVLPRSCLDLCAHAPAAISRGPHGTAAHPRLKPDDLPVIVEALCD